MAELARDYSCGEATIWRALHGYSEQHEGVHPNHENGIDTIIDLDVGLPCWENARLQTRVPH
jgi:hypothetical protein